MKIEDKVREALRGVVDPELFINVVDLGLVYGVFVEEGGRVKIEMTLTSPGCPLAGVIDSEVKKAVKKVKGVKSVKLDIVWDPPWTIEMISEEAKAELGFF
ncbi:DUF59 domain-containing protein [Candidatus Collierbacteria bacterium]|nr:DUF59 domain-containing protein [Candidatus Collierbacteria bacterium]